jgi:hypothetical protein
MHRIAYSALAILFVTSCASAQQPLSDSEIRTAFSGKKVEWGTAGIADYKSDGGYEYFLKSTGEHFRGQFVVGANRLCYDFPSGTSQCDRIMKDKDGIYMINASGAAYRAKFLR